MGCWCSPLVYPELKVRGKRSGRVGDSEPLHGSGSADITHKFKGRWGGVSMAEGVGELELDAGLVPVLEDEAPDSGDKP